MTPRSTQAKVALRSVRRVTRRLRRRGEVSTVRQLGERLSVPGTPVPYEGPADLAAVKKQFLPAPAMSLVDGRVPLVWWTDTPNFGDLLSPWLVGRIAERPVVFAGPRTPALVAVGSVVTRARNSSTVWGSGSFGSERRSLFAGGADYRAVRGPLTRSRLVDVGIDCPRVYGDPALLVPLYFWPQFEKTHDIGVVIRHSETNWRQEPTDGSVKVIDFGSEDIDSVLRDILSCRRIISSSLHGLVIADAYGLPNAWLGTDKRVGGSRPNGGEFKYLDYFASVGKLRPPHYLDLRTVGLDGAALDRAFDFDDRPIEFDHSQLLDACPLLTRA